MRQTRAEIHPHVAGPPSRTDRMLIFSERQLRYVLGEYENHDNTHRPHRSLKQLPPIADVDIGADYDGPIERTEILGSLINEYRHAA